MTPQVVIPLADAARLRRLAADSQLLAAFAPPWCAPAIGVHTPGCVGMCLKPGQVHPGPCKGRGGKIRRAVRKAAGRKAVARPRTTRSPRQAPPPVPAKPGPPPSGPVKALPAGVLPAQSLAGPKGPFTVPVAPAQLNTLKHAYEGTHGGLTSHLTRAEHNHKQVSVEGRITDAHGNPVGAFTRRIRYDPDGTTVAEHMEMEIDHNVQGQGFAQGFNAQAFDYYRAAGVDQAELTANKSVGSYAWARAGYDWLDTDATRAPRRRLQDLALSQGPGAQEASALLRRFETVGFGEPGYPTPYEITEIGRPPGATRQDMWPGKTLMLSGQGDGFQWRGVYRLRRAPAPVTAAAAATDDSATDDSATDDGAADDGAADAQAMTREEMMHQLAAWHDQWVDRNLDAAPFTAAEAEAAPDYNLHFVDLEASSQEQDEFARTADEIIRAATGSSPQPTDLPPKRLDLPPKRLDLPPQRFDTRAAEVSACPKPGQVHPGPCKGGGKAIAGRATPKPMSAPKTKSVSGGLWAQLFTPPAGVSACLKPGEVHPGPCPGSHHSGLIKKIAAVPRKKTAPEPKTAASGPGPRSGRNLAKEMDLAQIGALARRDERGADRRLAAIAKAQGFDAAPQATDRAGLDAAVAAGGRQLWRGVIPKHGLSAAQIHGEFADGDAHYGQGIFGNGVYFSNQQGIARMYSEFSTDPDAVARMVLPKTARTITYSDLVRQMAKDPATVAAGADHEAKTRKLLDDLAKAKGRMAETRMAWEIYQGNPGTASPLSDPGLWAASRGYDAVIVAMEDGETEEVVLLNRGAAMVEKARARTASAAELGADADDGHRLCREELCQNPRHPGPCRKTGSGRDNQRRDRDRARLEPKPKPKPFKPLVPAAPGGATKIKKVVLPKPKATVKKLPVVSRSRHATAPPLRRVFDPVIEACLPPHVAVPKPGPCPGHKRVTGLLKKALGKTRVNAVPKAAPVAPRRLDVGGHLDFADLAGKSRDPGRADLAMREIVRLQGFDDRAAAASTAELDGLVARGGIEMFQPFQGPDPKTDMIGFIDGDVDWNKGVYGSGFYAAARRDAYPNAAQVPLMRMVLPADAKIIDIGALDAMQQAQQQAASKRQRDLISEFQLSPPGPQRQAVLERYQQWQQTQPHREQVLRDPGRLAAALGYDAIHVPGTTTADRDEYVLINRSKVHAQSPHEILPPTPAAPAPPPAPVSAPSPPPSPVSATTPDMTAAKAAQDVALGVNPDSHKTSVQLAAYSKLRKADFDAMDPAARSSTLHDLLNIASFAKSAKTKDRGLKLFNRFTPSGTASGQTPPQPVIPPANSIPGQVRYPTSGGVTGMLSLAAERGEPGDGWTTLPNGRSGPWGRYGAAGVLLRHVDRGGQERFLMVQRGSGISDAGMWQFPGGAIDSKESAAQGATREVIEELGFKPGDLANARVHGQHETSVPDLPDWKYTSFAATVPDQLKADLSAMHAQLETADARWLTVEEIRTLDVDGRLLKPLANGALEQNLLSLFPATGRAPVGGAGVPAAGHQVAVGRDLVTGPTAQRELLNDVSASRQRFRGKSADERLSAITARQGFDGLPQVASKQEMDRLLATGQYIEAWRGVRGGNGKSAAQINEELRSGPAYYGLGVFGNGYYLATERSAALGYHDFTKNSLVRVLIPKNARTETHQRVLSRATVAVSSSGGFAHVGAEGMGGGTLHDEGRYAAAWGLDGVEIPQGSTSAGYHGSSHIAFPGKPSYNWVNRTVLIVQEPEK